MAMPFEYAHPLGEVDPIIEFGSISDILEQMSDFAARGQSFRAGVADTSFFPFSAICKLLMRFPSGTYGGTGFYIAPDLILTAGHNVFDRAPGGGTEAATMMTIRPGQQQTGVHLDEFTVNQNDWTVHPRWQSSGATDRGFDMAVIRVTRPPEAGEYFEIAEYSPAPQVPVAVCGYSGQDVASDRQHLDIDFVRRLSEQNEVVEYNLQTRRGGSGSPVFLDFLNLPGGDMPSAIPVMGVHVARGDAQHNRGVLLTPEKISWARGGGIMSVAQNYSRGLSDRGSLGGLPLVSRSRSNLGGLPLLPANPTQRPPAPQRPAASPPATAQSYRARTLTRSWIVADPDRGMSVSRRTFGKDTNDLSGKTTLRVIVRNMPAGGSVRWNIPDADDRTRVLFEVGNGTSPSATGTEVTLRSLAAGIAEVDCMVKDASGATIESNKYVISSPHFVRVVFDPTVNTFLAANNLGTRRQAIIDEMRSITSLLYENVNIRFIMPGDTLPAHLDNGANAAFPGGRAVATSVSMINVRGDEQPQDPEETHRTGVPSNFSADTFGRNHSPGDLPPPLDQHNISTVLLAHFDDLGDVNTVQTAIAAGGASAANLDQAATMFGRLLGETSSHELGHNPAGTFRGHNVLPDGVTLDPAGLQAHGQHRTFEERTGMAAGTGGNLLIDNGTGGINRLNATNLRVFEEAMPVNPPLDAAQLRSRGRVGSFAVRSRAISGETVHLPGATVLEGWQAEMLIMAIEQAIAAALSGGNPALFLANQFIVDIDRMLDVCDSANISIGFGGEIGGGAGVGRGAGAGLVLAPGRRVGFYGALSEITGAFAGAGVNAQVTVLRGGPENFGGSSYTVGVSVGTIGWFDAGTLDIPVGAHVVFNTQGDTIGFVAEVGVSGGPPMPWVVPIEGYAQAVWTNTTFSQAQGTVRSLSASDPSGTVRSRAISEAVARGASPNDAAAFADQLFS